MAPTVIPALKGAQYRSVKREKYKKEK